jgi:Mce-associated membrane protein
MSSQNPPTGGASRRRRIAGERKGTRPPLESGAVPGEAPEGSAGEPSTPATQAAPAEGVTTPEAGPRREARAVSTPVLSALAVAAVLLVAFAASGFFVDGVGVAAWRQVDEESQVETAERAAPAAAERAAAAILSYSHESLEADRDNAARFMTGSYRKEYLDTFGLVLDNAPEVKAVVEAEVKASGVVHADPGRANVLLFVNQTTTSTANEGEPQIALNRVMLTMQLHDGTWLVDDITSY